MLPGEPVERRRTENKQTEHLKWCEQSYRYRTALKTAYKNKSNSNDILF